MMTEKECQFAVISRPLVLLICELRPMTVKLSREKRNSCVTASMVARRLADIKSAGVAGLSTPSCISYLYDAWSWFFLEQM